MKMTVLKQMILGGAKKISEKKEKLNKINVFPIPDGDTGTNMEKTILGGVRILTVIGNRDFNEKDFDNLYNGILMSSQGNSGVILSQWFKGFLGSMKYAEEVSAITLNEAFLYATESSYEAVVEPVEGTFLTVAREAQEMAEEIIDEDTSLEEYLASFLEFARQSLNETPEKLPVLKKAGVVDSGAMGFVYMISGMLETLDESYSFDPEEFNDMMPDMSLIQEYEAGDDVKLDEFGYCTELIVQLADDNNEFRLNDSISYLNEIGNSVVAVQDSNIVKIHVHTLKPEMALAHFHKFGEFRKLKIENMSLQHNEMQHVHIRSEKAIVAVVNGPGCADVFREMGVDVIIDRSAKEELSVGQIVEGVKETEADEVVLMLDDKNLHLLTIGVQEICKDVKVHAISAKNVPDEYAALSTIDLEKSAKEIAEDMDAGIADSISCIIKKADNVSNFNDLDIKPGDYIAEIDGEYSNNYSIFADVMKSMLDDISDIADKESIVAFCCDQKAYDEMEACKALIRSYCPYAEVFVIMGGQEENYVEMAVQ